jgi:outer membrane protein assembly factor BamD (BamD/ComL family)
MTVKLNLTIDEKILAKSKRYAASRKTTVSKMVLEFLKRQIAQDEKKVKKYYLEKSMLAH